MKISFVIGMEHSGSTAMGFKLSQNNLNSVYIGESLFIYRKRWTDDIKEGTERECSCLKKYKDCPFWGSIIKDLEKSNVTPTEFLNKILEKAKKENYDEIIDTSKHSIQCNSWMGLVGKDNVRIVHTLRPFRQWYGSMKSRKKHKNWIFQLLRWLFINLKINMKFRKFDYELVKITERWSLKPSTHHIAGSNKIKFNKKG